MKVLVLGSNGMLGFDLLLQFKKTSHVVLGTGRLDLDITQRGAVNHYIQHERPEWVILAAAFTRVDDCETQRKLARAVNVEGTYHVASACRSLGARLCYISTDYIFNGEQTKPYCEEDMPNPLNFYAETKLKGEMYIKEILKDFLIIRTSWLFGTNGRNFVNTIIEKAKTESNLQVVNDQIGSPTYTRDLATGIITLIESNNFGVFNITNSGSCTWYEFAQRIMTSIGFSEVKINPISSKVLGAPAQRPANSCLSTNRFCDMTGTTLRSWHDALNEYLKADFTF